MTRILLVIAVIALYVLHQDFWFWRTAEPIIFGALPIGIFYHVCYMLAVSLLMWTLVRLAWPVELEEGGKEAQSSDLSPSSTNKEGQDQ